VLLLHGFRAVAVDDRTLHGQLAIIPVR